EPWRAARCPAWCGHALSPGAARRQYGCARLRGLTAPIRGEDMPVRAYRSGGAERTGHGRMTGRCTHHIEFRGDVVIKRYRSWDRGEPGREWTALKLLAEHAPGVAPSPVRAMLDADPPAIVMSRLP